MWSLVGVGVRLLCEAILKGNLIQVGLVFQMVVEQVFGRSELLMVFDHFVDLYVVGEME